MPSAAGTLDLNQRRLLPIVVRESWPVAATIALLACLLIGFGVDPLRTVDRQWGDELLRLRFRMGLEPKPDARVFLVGVETSDLVGAGTTKAEYQIYSDIVDSLTDLQVSAVGVDLIMMRGDAADSRSVVESIRRNGHVVLGELRTPSMIARSFPFAKPEFPSGQIAIAADSDGVHRLYIWGIADKSTCAPSMALATYLASFRPARMVLCDGAGDLIWKELSPDAASLVERKIPAQGSMLNFRSSWKQAWDRGFKYISARKLAEEHNKWKEAGADPAHVPAGLPTRGNLALIGSVATGAGDAGPTPFGTTEPFLHLQATALDDLLQRRSLRELSSTETIALTLGGLLLIGIVGHAVRGIPGLIFLCVAAIVAVPAIGLVMLVRADLMLPGITPAAFMAVGLLGESGRRASLSSIEKVQLRETLGRYFSPNVLKDVLKNPEAMQPREAKLTVLLTDVRNFTTITEKYGTRRTFDLLNDVFEVQTQAVIAADGSMEHFVGDQFLAYWGAPQDQPDAADRALEAAANIIQGLDGLHETLEPGVKELFGYGVAIHCGNALFGNKGARARLDYGILGDIVNGAARIESLTKYYGVRQIVTREVMDKVTKRPPARFLDRIRVKGKAQPIEIFDVVVRPTEQKMALVQVYENAWREYERGDFAVAASLFDAWKDCDKPSRVLADRCRDLMAAPPLHWHGEYQFNEK